MAISASSLRIDVNQILKNGEPVRFRYFNTSFAGGGSYYDDDIVLTQSGTDFWTSGLVFPVNTTRGSTDAFLVEQGRLLSSDLKLFVVGTVETSGLFKVGIGSPNLQEFAVVEDGVHAYKVGTGYVYKKLYLRHLPTGGLTGE